MDLSPGTLQVPRSGPLEPIRKMALSEDAGFIGKAFPLWAVQEQTERSAGQPADGKERSVDRRSRRVRWASGAARRPVAGLVPRTERRSKPARGPERRPTG